MAGRGPQTFAKRQKEQRRKEKQAEKQARRLLRKHESRPEEDAGESHEAASSEQPDSFERP